MTFRKINNFLVLTCLIAGNGWNEAIAAYPENYIDKNHIINLLRQEKFAQLDQLLIDIQKRHEKGEADELDVWHAFQAFANSDPSLENLLVKFSEQRASSFVPHLGLAEYHQHLGWLSRGGKWSKDTPKKKFAKMRAHFHIAKEQYFRVLNINSKLLVPYVGLMRISYSVGLQKQVKVYADEALKIDPSSYLIHYRRLFSLQPKWGGTIREIENYLGMIRKYYNLNPRLKSLNGFLDYVEGNRLVSRSKSCRSGVIAFNTAIEKGEHPFIYAERGDNYHCMRKYKQAIDDYNKAIALMPQDVSFLAARGKTYYKLKKYQLALKDFNEAILLDKMNWRALRDRGRLYYTLKKPDNSLRDLNDALSYNYDSAITRRYLGYVHYYYKKNYELAAEHLKKAVSINGKYSYDWYLLSAAQWSNRDCQFVASAKKYIEICESTRKCEQKNVQWAKKSAEYSVDKGVCPSSKN